MLDYGKPKRKNEEKQKREDYWVHWKYNPDEWLQFARSEWRKKQKELYNIILMWVIFTSIPIFCSLIARFAFNPVWLIITSLPFMLLATLSTAPSYYTYYLRLRCHNPQVYINLKGIVREPEDDVIFYGLHPLFTVIISRNLLEFHVGAMGTSSIRVLIAKGCETEARQLVSHFYDYIHDQK